MKTGEEERRLAVLLPGRTTYDAALRLQLDRMTRRWEGTAPDTLILTEHEPVVTVGRSSEAADLPRAALLAERGIALRESARGGKATYHGPGQLMGYAVVDLRPRGRDLHRFMDDLQAGVVEALRMLGVEAHGREGLRGVWAGTRKIASLGVAVRRWVTYHGFALNVSGDLEPFRLINPCGLGAAEVTCIADVLGLCPDPAAVRGAVVEAFARRFGYAGWGFEEAGVAECGEEPGLRAGNDTYQGRRTSAPAPLQTLLRGGR